MTGASTAATMSGTAAAAASLLTVTRTSSLPASCRARTCAVVAATSAVSVFVMDWTTMGCVPPTFTPPTSTTTVCLRCIRQYTSRRDVTEKRHGETSREDLNQKILSLMNTESVSDLRMTWPANGVAPVFETVTAIRAHTESLVNSGLALDRSKQDVGRMGGQLIGSSGLGVVPDTAVAATLNARALAWRVPAESPARYTLNASVPEPLWFTTESVPEIRTESTMEDPAPSRRISWGALDVSTVPGFSTAYGTTSFPVPLM